MNIIRKLSLPTLLWIGCCLSCVAQTSGPGTLDSERVFRDAAIGNRKLRYLCLGVGSPTVIVEPGLGGVPLETVFNGDSRTGWARIAPEVAAETRICIYDRAGVGMSDSAPIPRTSLDTVIDLEDMLRVAGIEPPYVLVGHSFGGLNARLFASRQLEAVAGMVLIDSTHPNLWKRWSEVLPPPADGERPELSVFRAPPDPGVAPEGIDVAASLDLVPSGTVLEDTPLVVVTVRSDFDDPNVPNDLESMLRPVAYELQRELVNLSWQSELIVARSAGHNIHLDEPQLVARIILDMVERGRSRE